MRSRGKTIAVLAGCGVVVILGAFVCLHWEEIRLWYFLREDFKSLKKNRQGYREYRHRQTGIVFVKLPSGTFWMGSPETEKNREDNELQHEGTLSPFLIAKYEVSQAEWAKVMGGNPSHFKGENLPVDSLSWEDCHRFCEKTGLKLPSEAQWEYACRAGTTGPFGGTGTLGDMGWHNGNSGGTTHAVGQKSPNGFGLYDMHASIWEWCEDVYDPEFYTKPEASRKNPVSTSGSANRVIRGGSWNHDAGYCRSASRGRLDPSNRYRHLGLRVAFYPLP